MSYLQPELPTSVSSHPNSKSFLHHLSTFLGNQLDGIFPSYSAPRKNSFVAYYSHFQSNHKYLMGTPLSDVFGGDLNALSHLVCDIYSDYN